MLAQRLVGSPRLRPRGRVALALCLAAIVVASCETGDPPTVAPRPSPSTPPTPAPGIPGWLTPPPTAPADPAAVPLRALVPNGATPVQRVAIAPGDGVPAQLAASWESNVPLDLGSGVAPASSGVVLWQRFADPGRWLPVTWFGDGPEAGVLGISMRTGDATRDGHPDVLVFSATGGSGGCGIVRVLGSEGPRAGVLFDRSVCDAEVSVVPRGLLLREAAFRPGDAHCCPSATRTSVLAYAGDGRWTVASRRVHENP